MGPQERLVVETAATAFCGMVFMAILASYIQSGTAPEFDATGLALVASGLGLGFGVGFSVRSALDQ